MKITILTDNSAAPHFLATHGFSCYIEADIKVLFDLGPDDTFLRNAERLNLEMKPDFIVLSHGHWDHCNGFEYAPMAPIVCHPSCFLERYSKFKDVYVGIKMLQSDVSKKYKLQLTRKPLKLSGQIIFLGEIPRLNKFESQTTDFCDPSKNDDFIFDDSALAIKTDKGLVVVSGCAHSGICNTVDYAIKITGVDKVHAVFGGFHLKSPGEITQKTIQYFQDLGVKEVHPSHCTSLPALAEFYKVFRQPQVLAGNYYVLS